jgi:hypothetical protein
LPAEPGLRLGPETRVAIRRAQYVLVEDELPAEERALELADWIAHLDQLPEAQADEARHQLARFAQLADGLRALDEEEAEPEP